MPARLRPNAQLAPDAILVGDPGRSLLLAQELLAKPKMSNHARGLWGYTGRTAAGDALTIQATGMGGPSAALVLADLAKLGVERVVRVGTCAAFGPRARLGKLLLVEAALATGGSAASFGIAAGETVAPEPALHERLAVQLGKDAQPVTVASLDTMPTEAAGEAADMQTLAVLRTADKLGMAAAAVLVVSERDKETIGDEELEAAAKRAGHAAMTSLSR